MKPLRSYINLLKRTYCFTALFLAILLPARSQTVVWQENFEGNTLDPFKWNYDIGDGCNRGICGWGNGELQYYTSRTNNVRIENGNLVIEARKENLGGKDFTSARVTTMGRVHFKYGTLEARIKIPNLKNGLWPAFWTLGVAGIWPASGEIDIMELGNADAFPDSANHWLYAAAHWEFQNRQADYGLMYKSAASLADDYHIYKMVWTPTTIRVFIDDIQYYVIDITHGADADLEEFHSFHYILLNLAVGGRFPKIFNTSEITAQMPAQMLVDYIKLSSDQVLFPPVVNIGSISSSSFCSGSAIDIPYTTGGSFTTGNIFTAQLSNATGSFSNPVTIGSLTSTGSGTISATIPANTPTGFAYRIRIVASDPSITGDYIGNDIVINVVPSVPTITSGGPLTFCEGGSAILTSGAAVGNQWYKDGVAISGASGITYNATTGGHYTIRVTVNNCQSAVSNAVVVLVNPIPPAPAITAGSATTFCEGGTVTLTSNASGGNQWYRDNLPISGSSATAYIANSSGNYTAKRSVSGCESPSSNTIVVTVNANPPAPTITQNGIQLISNAASGNQWFLNGVAIAGAVSQNYTPATSGNYSVQVTVNGCTSAISAAFNFTVTSIADVNLTDMGIKLFPNPVLDKLIITHSGFPVLNIRITDIRGKEIRTFASRSSRIEIDMSAVGKGAYLIWIEDKRAKRSGKKMFLKL